MEHNAPPTQVLPQTFCFQSIINKACWGMRKKYKTLEELREARAASARKWRAENKVLARERVAAVYGKAKYPEMVEANSRAAKKAAKEAQKPQSTINNVSEEEKFVEETYSYDDDPTDGRTVAEKKAHQAMQARRSPAVRVKELVSKGWSPGYGMVEGKRKSVFTEPGVQVEMVL